MINKISDIEGIGPLYATKLREAGIRSVATLLKRCATKAGREEVARQTGIDKALLLKWTNMADLFRIRGIGSEYSELLENAGVDTVKELKVRVPQNLYEKVSEVNAEKKLVRILPTLIKIENFIREANKLEPVITHEH